MKRKKRRSKIPGVQTALAVATKLGLRRHKGLDGVPPEAMTVEAADRPEMEDMILDTALGALKPITDDQVRELSGPGYAAVGDTVFIPFIGSALESAGGGMDAEGKPIDVKTQFTTVEYEKMTKKARKVGPQTCGTCFGWGTVGEKKCPRCKGKKAV